jgi:hypothetical protein
VSPEIKVHQIWATRRCRMRGDATRIRLLRIIAVHPETIAYVTHSDTNTGPIVRKAGTVVRQRFTEYNQLFQDAP